MKRLPSDDELSAECGEIGARGECVGLIAKSEKDSLGGSIGEVAVRSEMARLLMEPVKDGLR